MAADWVILDFTHAGVMPNGKPEMDSRGRVGKSRGGRKARSTNPKAIRARARYRANMTAKDVEQLYKPIEEWDLEELARGRPKNKNGHFTGRPPRFLDRTLHEEILKRYQEIVKMEMNTHTVEALNVLGKILKDDSVDMNGKRLVNASTKLDAAKYLVDHVLGKPKQRTETDVSVKLQGMLGLAMVNPSNDSEMGFELAQGYDDQSIQEKLTIEATATDPDEVDWVDEPAYDVEDEDIYEDTLTGYDTDPGA